MTVSHSSASAIALPSAPGIVRRVGAMVYEALLLLALLLTVSFPVAGLQGATLAGASHVAFQVYLGAVVVLYFVWCWVQGQTLPMKTWQFRVSARSGRPLTAGRALLRLLLAALFLGPACVGVVLLFFPQRVSVTTTVWLFVPAMATILFARFDPDRQFLHDKLAGTRLHEVAAR